ncbi:flavin reductase [Micromonospora sp. M12]
MADLDVQLRGEHMPRRPQWDCQTCEQDWPCDPARVRLAEQYGANRINLSIYLGGLLFVATAELADANPGDLYERFIAWTK